ncbi:hypothetical protein O1L55_13770 [Streptomyces albulus]|nr:hypothetical protein [Streptomyces noursei]
MYGAGAQDAARQIADRVSAGAPVSSASVPAGHVQVVLGADFTAPPATGATTRRRRRASPPARAGRTPPPRPYRPTPSPATPSRRAASRASTDARGAAGGPVGHRVPRPPPGTARPGGRTGRGCAAWTGPTGGLIRGEPQW